MPRIEENKAIGSHAPRTRADVVFRRTPDGGMLIDLSSSACFGVNRVGADIWEQLAAGRSIDEIASSLAAEYRLDRVLAERDVLRICEEMCSTGLLLT